MNAVSSSSLPNRRIAEGQVPSNFAAALRILAHSLPSDTPSIVVFDEIPWLLESIQGGAGQLQNVWDQELSQKPVLLLLLGSDITMMQELSHPSQPFYGRAREMILGPMTPLDVSRWTATTGINAFDAYIMTGGQPLVAEDWHDGTTAHEFLMDSLNNPVSALVTEGSRVLDGEFPPGSHARTVLTAIGGRGERTYTGVLNSVAGRLSPPTLESALSTLVAARIVTADEPLSIRRSPKNRRWRIEDPALRYWLACVEPSLADVDRGRPDLAFQRIQAQYPSWRGRAIEPIVRGAMERLLPDNRIPHADEVGGWWPRSNIPEVDITAVDSSTSRLGCVGTIKWRDSAPVSNTDVNELLRDAMAVPGYTPDVPLVAVCPKGSQDPRISVTWTAEDLLMAWE
jgi:AAA+ ATPase superfamily predicted ATPase